MSNLKPCKLTRISTKPNDEPNLAPLRTESVVGNYVNAPCPGEPFQITAEPLTEGATVRVVTTSVVVEVEKMNFGFRFKTQNSTYELETVLG